MSSEVVVVNERMGYRSKRIVRNSLIDNYIYILNKPSLLGMHGDTSGSGGVDEQSKTSGVARFSITEVLSFWQTERYVSTIILKNGLRSAPFLER